MPTVAVSVLIADDDRAVAELCRLTLVDAGCVALVVHSAADALAALDRHEIDILLSDVKMPGMDGIELLRSLTLNPHPPDVVLMTAFGSVASAVEAVKLGAYDYVEKPFQPALLQSTIQLLAAKRAVRARNMVRPQSGNGNLICGASRIMLAVSESIHRVAKRDRPVLLTGETGTGKELIARAIHEVGLGQERPFVAVDCGSLSPSIIESELFGHVRGAYTGALGARRGLLETSRGGTLFLDEIGELPLSLQTKFFRVLQDREFRPLGADMTRRFEGRIIAATNRDLERAVALGEFRAELYYRLRVHTIQVPPLRARKVDIPLLAQHFIQKHGDGRVLTITPEAMETLANQDWPGNVRELENCVISMIANCDGHELESRDIPLTLRKAPSSSAISVGSLDEAERSAIIVALDSSGWSVAAAAERLAVSKATLYRKINSHGLKRGAPIRQSLFSAVSDLESRR